MIMIYMAGGIFLICVVAGTWDLIYCFIKQDDVKRWYIGAKGLVILFLGSLYGVVALDHWVDVINYPASINSPTWQLLRIVAFLSAVIFLMDSWIRNKL
jgi:hypothetical protein